MPPLVSICIPTYNSERWLADSLGSALAQDYAPLEILVLDNASTDGTADLARGMADGRVRVLVNERNVGAVRNFNRCIQAARGDYVKLLMSDDLLHPDCCREMAAMLDAHSDMGMVFAPRRVVLEDPEDPVAREWERLYGRLHLEWDRLEAVNPAESLFRQYLEIGFRVNWVGEPTSVLVRRRCYERIGMFNHRLHQGIDFEMWARLMYFYGVGFIDRELSTFRYQYASGSFENHFTNRSWLDMLWLIEGLLAHPEIRADCGGRVARLRWKESARALRALVLRSREGLWPDVPAHWRALRDYAAYRLTPLGRRPDLHHATG